jgi:hypothetical protein
MTEDLKQRFPIGSRWTDTGGRPGNHVVVLDHNEDAKTVKVFYVEADREGFVFDLYAVYRHFEPYVEPVKVPDFERFLVVDGDGHSYSYSPSAVARILAEQYPFVFRAGVRNGEPFIERVAGATEGGEPTKGGR